MVKRGSVLLLVLFALFLGLKLCSYSYVIYNNSGLPIQQLTLRTKWCTKSFVNLKDQQVIEGALISPYYRTITVELKNYNQSRSAALGLSGVFSGNQYNQIEVGFGGEIKVGELGR